MKKLWGVIIFSIILRIVLAFSTYHQDLQALNLAGKIIASGNVLTFYDYLSKLPLNDPTRALAVFNYPPAGYLFHGLFNFLFSNFLGISQINQFILDLPSNYGNFQFDVHLLLLKIPYLIFDLLTGWVLYKLFDSRRKATLALILWLFNPVNLYVSYMMADFDIIPTFFTILSIYFIAKNRLNLSALSLGFGIAFKLFPLFLVIPLLILGKNFKEKAILIVISVLPYVLSIMPYIPSHNFRTNALFANQSSKSLYAALPVSGGESIIYFPLLLLFFYLLIWGYKQFLSQSRMIEVWKLYLIPLLLFFIFTHYHPQWLIWITPILIMELVESGFKNLLSQILIYLSWFGSLFFFDPGLTINMFAPIAPALYNVPSVWTLLKINIDYNFSRSIIQTIFASASVYLIYLYFPYRKKE